MLNLLCFLNGAILTFFGCWLYYISALKKEEKTHIAEENRADLRMQNQLRNIMYYTGSAAGQIDLEDTGHEN